MNTPQDLFDVICQLDDLADWLKTQGYTEAAEQITATSWTLKGCVVLSVPAESKDEHD